MDQPALRYLKNALLIDGTGAVPVPNAGLLLQGNRIERVVPPEEAHLVPAEAETVDLGGRTVMPGLIDMHVHLYYPRWVRGKDCLLWEQPEKTGLRVAANARALLYAGFTTIRDVGNRGECAQAVRDAIAEGLIEGPRILASGVSLTTTAGLADRYAPWMENRANSSRTVDGPEEVRKAVRTLLKEGVDNVKLEVSGGEASPFCHSWDATMSYEEIAMAVREASKAGKTVAVHAQANQGIKNAVRAGVTTVEHATYLDRETALAMRDQGIFIVPTIACIFSWLELGLASAVPEAVEEMRINKEPWLNSIRMAAELGIKIANGSDMGNRYRQGDQARELDFMVRQVGFSPMEAIVAATRTAAESGRIADRVGTLEAGKQADLLVVEGDPSRDVTLLQDPARIRLIMKGGVSYKDTLQ